jgi:hypothetical protein
MKDYINNICGIEIAIASEVNNFIEGSSGFVHTDATFIPIDFVPGATLTIQKTKGKPGRSYETNLESIIRNQIDLNEGYILRIRLDDANPPLIIGDKDLPVFIQQSSTLTRKSMSVTHSSWHYPWRQFIGS